MKSFISLLWLGFGLLTAFSQSEQEIIASLPFRNIGPAFMSGRIADIEKDPSDPSTWYVAVASGNVWKTHNNGGTWEPIFEHYGSFSTGCIALDPQNPKTLWLGTGENQSQRSVSWGDGVYKSTDGGKSWKNMGLQKSEHIGKILLHPQNPDVVYVAAQGPLWAAGGDRGVYKSYNGGKSWEQVLAISEHTGVSDLCFDPTNPNIMYAASYQRRRHAGILVAGGEESRIYKSIDGGENWNMLTRGLPTGELGRIALAVSPQKPEVVYSLIAGSEPHQSGFYRSEDYGESWEKQNEYIVVDPQYYGEIFADPHQFDKVYAVDVIIHYTENGGRSFERLNSRFKHVDNHDIVFDPQDPNYLMVGCDGGIYESWDKGNSWTYHDNLPIMQFYRVGLDNEAPFYNVYGGTQDNSTLYGPSRTASRHGITNADWELALGGDGFQARIDPEDPHIVYCQSQYAGIVRYNRKTGQRLDIQPQPHPSEDPLRWHWDSPLLISSHNPKRLYFAAQKLFRSDDRGDSWTAISGDLSRGEDRNQRRVMGKIWSPEAVWKNVFTSPYGTIVSLAESPLREGLLVVGTDDGLIQVTEDDGNSWRKVQPIPGIPEKAYVADVLCSQHDAQVLYAVFNHHKEGDFRPYIAKSEDLGRSWNLITDGIEAPHACWSIVEDHLNPKLLFIATEYGLFCSINGGNPWYPLKKGLPTIAFRDLEIQPRENDLVAASFGRGMFILDDYALLRTLRPGEPLSSQFFPVKDTWQYFERGDRGYSTKGVFGDNFFTAPNPPYGAIFNVFLENKAFSKKERRKQAESAGKEGYPSLDSLKAEDFEGKPQFFIAVRDENGNPIAQVPVANRRGVQQLTWDLSAEVQSPDRHRQKRIKWIPEATYYAQLMAWNQGDLVKIDSAQSFQVKRLPLSSEAIPTDSYSFFLEVAQTLMEAEDLEEKMEEGLENLTRQQDHLLTTGATSKALKKCNAQRLALLEMQYELLGNQTLRKHFEYFLPGIKNRIQRVYNSQWQSEQITHTQRENFTWAKEGLTALKKKMAQLGIEQEK